MTNGGNLSGLGGTTSFFCRSILSWRRSGVVLALFVALPSSPAVRSNGVCGTLGGNRVGLTGGHPSFGRNRVGLGAGNPGGGRGGGGGGGGGGTFRSLTSLMFTTGALTGCAALSLPQVARAAWPAVPCPAVRSNDHGHRP